MSLRGTKTLRATIWGVILVLGFCCLGITGCAEGPRTYSKEIGAIITNVLKQNPYMQIAVGEERYIYAIYNVKGEAVVESEYGGVAFYRTDNSIVAVGDEQVTIEKDLSPLLFLKTANELAARGGGKVSITKEDMDEFFLYTITFNGKDEIRKIYSGLGTEAADRYMEILYRGFENVENSQLTIKITSGEAVEFGAVCEMTFGEESYTSWRIFGFIPNSGWEWQLEEGWYSNDTNDVQAWNKMANDLVEHIALNLNLTVEELREEVNMLNLDEIDVEDELTEEPGEEGSPEQVDTDEPTEPVNVETEVDRVEESESVENTELSEPVSEGRENTSTENSVNN